MSDDLIADIVGRGPASATNDSGEDTSLSAEDELTTDPKQPEDGDDGASTEGRGPA